MAEITKETINKANIHELRALALALLEYTDETGKKLDKWRRLVNEIG
jgi:hypothetical protein|tara:strand:- start:663 stop:803 length:141 start_codon:yes stop_codon:yes gene_type:complete